MTFLGGRFRFGGRLFLTATLVWLGGCSIAPHRDFAEVTTHRTDTPQTDTPTATTPELIVATGDAAEDLSPLLARRIDRSGLPGVAAVVLRGDRIVAQGVAGVRRRGTEIPVTLDDQFEISSAAKAMSAMLIARLVETGQLEWDRPLASYFTGERFHPDWKQVTLRQLITHTAGLYDPWLTFIQSTVLDRGRLPERRLAFVRRVLRAPLASRPGVQVAYCNTDYVVAAAAAERVFGQPWEQLMATHLFIPLGLRSAGFGPPGLPGQTLQPWGHGNHRLLQLGILGNHAFDPGSRGADYPAIASPAGYIHLSIQDWAKFVALHLRAHPANPNAQTQGLRRETFALLHGLNSEFSYAGGWNLDARGWAQGPRPTDTGRVLFHIGDNGRWTSAVWMAPEKDFAVLVVCNRGNQETAVDQIVSQLVTTYAGR